MGGWIFRARVPGQCIGITSKFELVVYSSIIHPALMDLFFVTDNKCLRLHKDNILQDNLFIVLTSVEMVALCRVMCILHFKVCKPLRWLAGNTHHYGQMGFD